MRVAVGLFPASPAWAAICRQEGVPHGAIAHAGEIAAHDWSAVVVTAPPDAGGTAALREYLRAGGGLLGFAGYVTDAFGWKSSREWISFLLPEGEIFGDVELVDLDLEGTIPSGAGDLRTNSGRFAVAAEPRGGGRVVLLPFDPAIALADTRAAYRAFYAAEERLPTERVSSTAKGEIRHLLHRALEHLHHAAGHPYAHLSWFPDGARSAFAFRVDTDGGTRSDIAQLYARAREHGLGFSWFLDVGSHASWLGDFAAMEGQEHGVHCFHHRRFRREEDLRADLQRAQRSMTAAGLDPHGAAATFGLWSPAFEHTVAELGFEYSSEFSLGYDTLPFQPGTRGIVQVPIHPICTGSLLRVGYSPAAMMAYFDRLIARKLSRSEPTFLYHHPLHRTDAVVEHLLSYVRIPGVVPMTLGGYARWWRAREGATWTCDLEGGSMRASVNGGPPDLHVCVSLPGGRKGSVRPGTVDLAVFPSGSREMHEPPRDVMRMREPDPRARVAQLYDMFLRRFR